MCVLKRNAKFEPDQVERAPRDSQKEIKMNEGGGTASIVQMDENI